MAGRIGQAPWPYTYGELSLMSEGVDIAQWWHTASLLSAIVGVCGGSKPPAAFHPYERERNKPRTDEQIKNAAEVRAIVWNAMCDALPKRGG